jgi:hypothetical protein
MFVKVIQIRCINCCSLLTGAFLHRLTLRRNWLSGLPR